MKIKTQSGSTSLEAKVENQISKLVILTKGTNVNHDTVKINVYINKKDGGIKRILTNFNVEVAAALSSIGVGYNTDIYDAAGANVLQTVRTIDLADETIQLLEDENIRVKLSGLTPADTVTIYGLQWGVTTSEVLMYKTIDVDSAADGKMINVSKYDYLMFDKTKLVEIRGRLSNGRNIDMTVEELELLQIQFNDKHLISKYADGDINETTYKNLIVLPLNHSETGVKITEFSVDTNASTDIWALWTEAIDENNTERSIKAVDSYDLPIKVKRDVIRTISLNSL